MSDHFSFIRLDFFILLIIVFLIVPSYADIPNIINYQGKVTDTGGIPVADGDYTMRFRVYDDATSGTLEWDSGNRTISVSGGVFNVLLGQSPQPAITLLFDEDYWLEVWIDGDTQTPRSRIGSVGYAYMASGLVPGTEVSGSVVTGSNAAIKGSNTAGTGSRYGVMGEAASTAGSGLSGSATATSGTTYGVYGSSASISGRGVYGTASATTGQAYGVMGQTNSTTGRGVYGLAGATTGTNYGVYGRSQSPTGYAGYFQGNALVTGDLTVDGTLTGSGIGDITAVTAGTGLDGGGTSGSVMLDVEVPLSLTGDAALVGIVHGTNSSANGRGVIGEATSVAVSTTYGVYGTSASPEGRGVYGGTTSTFAAASYGVYGTSASPSGRGIYGEATATSGTNFGVYGTTSSSSGYAGYFQGNARVTGDLTVDGTIAGVGDITSVTAGTGLSGGGTSGDISLSVAIPLSIAGSVTNSPYAVMKARNTGSTNDVAGIWGESACPGGGGVFGYGTATTGVTYGVLGQSLSTAGRGVWGYASAATGTTYGVYGETASPAGYAGYFDGDVRVTSKLTVDDTLSLGVPLHMEMYSGGAIIGAVNNSSNPVAGVLSGWAESETGSAIGVYGSSKGPTGYGVYGTAGSTSGINYGVYGNTWSGSGYGGYFVGDVEVIGTLSKGSGSFLIDHPLDPENKLLRHNFVESPENLLIYRGTARLNARGEAIVDLPAYFAALTLEGNASIQLTPIGSPFLTGYEWRDDNTTFVIMGDADREVSWMVLADRDDPVIHQLNRPVEEDKGPNNKYCDKGQLIYPEAFGYPESMGRDYDLHRRR